MLALIALAIVTAIPHAEAADAPGCTPWIAKAVGIQGQVETRRAGETRWQPVRLEQTFCGGDMIRVSERSRAAILLRPEETTLRLDERSAMTIPMVAPKIPRWLELLRGAANFLSRTPISLKIRTPFLNAHIEGTEFLVRVDEDETAILVFAGTVLAENRGGRIRLQSGQQAIAKAGQAPQRSLVLRPRDAVAWALYYPPIIDFRSEPYGGDTPALRAALSLYRQGKLPEALARLDEVPADRRDARYLDLRAAMLLSIGRVVEAQFDIAQALRLKGTHATAIALQSVIALVKNQKQKALRLARKAVSREPQSPVPRIALSYAQQASFDIEAALESSEEATQLAPDNGLAWARVAELELSLGGRGRAVKAAEKAVAFDPMLARTQTVLGFMKLAQIQLEDAQTSFEKAIRFDSADPLPRLGLGLAKIRQGKLEEGTEAIAIAATLDPNQSLIRSYLGKAYYEQKRDALARDEFKIAKGLDPKDPTPYFYDAIRKQTENRAVEALHDLESAIDRNDNRAVYRSRFLLDEDLAARSASLGRIYQELGFEQLGLIEAWKSVSAAPGNYSAHRFLADSYNALPRHQTARASELLQAQLLQPINVSPIQPQLAETNLFIQEGAGPTDLALNEYNPLFNRNRYALMASTIVGSNGTFGDEVVHSGIRDGISYSLGQFHYQTNGYRPNNDSRDDIYNLFVQGSLSQNTSLQGELRYTEADEGDRGTSFFPDDFKSSQRVRRETKTARLGVHNSLSVNSDLIVSFIFKEVKGNLQSTDPIVNADITATFDETAYLLEVQDQFRLPTIDFIVGAGHFNTINRTAGFTITSNEPFPFTVADEDTNDLNHTNAYVYSYFHPSQNLTTILGASANFFHGNLVRRNQLNPKFAFVWTPLPGTTLRAAAFRSLEPGLITGQTIEPAQLAGFAQVLTTRAEQDFESEGRQGVDTWRFGVGASHKVTPALDGGVELSKRDLRVQQPIENIAFVERWREYSARAYLYWAPTSRFSATADYQFERVEQGTMLGGGGTGIRELETHLIPIGLSFFHPDGLSVRLGATFVDQSGLFFSTTPDRAGADRFWVVDASVRYRLPKRFGLATFGVGNLLGEQFNFRELDAFTPTVQRDRFFFGRISLAF